MFNNMCRKEVMSEMYGYFGKPHDVSDFALAETYMKLSYIKEQVATHGGNEAVLFQKEFLKSVPYDQAKFRRLSSAFTKYNVFRFLCVIVPGFARDPFAVDELTRGHPASLRMQRILTIKNITGSKRTLDQTDELLEEAIKHYPLPIPQISAETNEAAQGLKNRNPNLEQQLWEATYFYDNDASKTSRKDRALCSRVKKVDALDLFCALTDDNKGDDALENGVLFQQVLEKIDFGNPDEHVLILNANPLFIRRFKELVFRKDDTERDSHFTL